ncbi:MAG TPA: hypothetical protein VMQ52_04500 [Candidatus Saccharimonadales bacterium]|jgi:hypothetical protein|nr:hypothetical protein [Candidatus Saccharimonadales bacterium]
MYYESQGFSYAGTAEIAAPQQTRFQRALEAVKDPALQETAKRIGMEVGNAAVHGALENAGVVKYDNEGNMHARPFKIARAVLRPRKTAQKAATGAVKGVRGHVQEQAVGMARQKLSEAYGGAQSAALEQAPAAVGWEGATESSKGWEPDTTAPATGHTSSTESWW